MKTTLTVLVIAAAVALAWALGRDPGEPTSLAPPSPAIAKAEETRIEPDLLGSAPVSRPGDWIQRTEIPEGIPELPEGETSPTPLDSTTAGNLEVLTVARETGTPLPAVRIFANADDGTPLEWVERDGRDGEPITDEAGRARLLVPPGSTVRLWASTQLDGARASRDLEVFESGESRTIRLEFTTQPDANLVGRVVETAGGAPIVGARVRLLSAFVSSQVDEASTQIRTGPEGYFETPVATWSRRYGRVDAEGFGPSLFKPERGHDTRSLALVVELQRGATLRGLISGVPDFADLVVRVDARGHELSTNSRAIFYAVGDYRQETSVAQDGTWELTDLPPDVGLQVELWRAEEHVRSEPERLRLRPGEERTLEWRLGGGATLRGRAVIADTGEPLVSSPIWLVGAAEAGRMLQYHADPVARTETDSQGSFTFPDLPPGQWGVGPAPSRSDWNQPEDDGIAPIPIKVTIPEGAREVEVELRVYRGLFIEGEILGVDGKRIESGYVRGVCYPVGFVSLREAVDGVFRLGPLVPGTYELTAEGDDEGTAEADPVHAQAGDENVVLQLRAGGSIQGQLVDAGNGDPVRGPVRIAPHEDHGRGWTMQVSQADGSFRLDGFSPGTYDVSATSGNLVGLVKDVVLAPSQSVHDLEILLEPGAFLLVTYVGEHTSAGYRVESEGMEVHMGRLERGLTSRSVLPPGQVVVTVNYQSMGGEVHTVKRTVDLVVGQETKVEFGDK